MKNIDRLARESEFPQIRELCKTLKEVLKEYKENEDGYFDLEVFRQKIRRLLRNEVHLKS